MYITKRNIFNILIRIPAPVILILSVYASSVPIALPLEGIEISDKLIHLVCFAGLSGAWSWWWPPDVWKKRPLRCALITVLAVSAYGVLDEFHQSFVPGRQVSAFDWAADTVGAVLGCAAGWFSVRFILFRKSAPSAGSKS
ncbi:MAG: VanZ family protein [Spirochaetaceae bacterium]|jgi:hypothetical protein|nr:VanZ family protein [Spirochaetaceae bacterium]